MFKWIHRRKPTLHFDVLRILKTCKFPETVHEHEPGYGVPEGSSQASVFTNRITDVLMADFVRQIQRSEPEM